MSIRERGAGPGRTYTSGVMCPALCVRRYAPGVSLRLVSEATCAGVRLFAPVSCSAAMV